MDSKTDGPSFSHLDSNDVSSIEQQPLDIDINSSLAAKIKNPLAGIPRHTLMRNVDEFADAQQLSDIKPLLRRGALIAQTPHDFENVEGLEDDEREALRNETEHKWRQHRTLYLTVILCSIGAAVQGWDQTGSNGANLSFPIAFGIPDSKLLPCGPDGSTVGCPVNPDAIKNSWLIGIINAGPYAASALFGCWCSDPLNRWGGRRLTILVSAIFCIVTPIGSAFSQNWYQLFICRLLMGIGMGCKASTILIYAAENVPASIRGGLVMSWQMCIWNFLVSFSMRFIKICANYVGYRGFAANLVVLDVGKIAWRLQLGSAFIPAVPLLLVYMCPESPRWYMRKGKYVKAYKSLCRLRNTPLQAARDLYYVHAQLTIEQAVIKPTNSLMGYVTRFTELFTIPRARRATLASFVVMIGQQMCGINIIAFYSSTIFVNAGASNKLAVVASLGFGAVNFIFAFPALWTIDTFGRRALLLFTFPNMAWTLLAAGLIFLIPESNNAHLGLIAFFVFLFGAFYSPGEGPVPFTYSAEVFPLSHREVGMSWAVATCLFWAAVLSITFPSMLSGLGVTGSFGLYAGLNVMALIMIFLFVPETKQRTLEELDYIFGVPTRIHASYQLTKVLPWSFRRYVLWQTNAPLKPLYQFDDPIAISERRVITNEKNETLDEKN